MNPYLDAPPAASPTAPPLGAAPPALTALAALVVVAVALTALGVPLGGALALGAIAASVTWLAAAARRVAHAWAHDPGRHPRD